MTLQLWLGLILPLAGAALLLLLLRRSLSAGRGAAAGFLAAILMGPDVLGRIAPDFFESAWIGGQQERQFLESAQRMQMSERIAAETAKVDQSVLEQMIRRHTEAEAALMHALRAEQNRIRRFRAHASGALAFLLLMFCTRRHGPSHSDGSAMLSAVNIGLFSSAVPAGIAALVLTYTGQPAAMILACAAPLAAGGMPRTIYDRDAGNQAEQSGAQLIAHAGRVATVLAIPLAVGAFVLAARFPFHELWPLLGIGAGLLLPGPARSGPFAAREPAWIVPALLTAIIALTGSLLAPIIDVHIGALIGLMVLTTDGRWLGAVIGAVLPGGRRALPSMRLAAGAMAAAPAQTAFTSVLFLAGVLQPAHAIGLLAGAVLAEVTAPMRRRAADHLAAAESEIDRLRDEDP